MKKKKYVGPWLLQLPVMFLRNSRLFISCKTFISSLEL